MKSLRIVSKPIGYIVPTKSVKGVLKMGYYKKKFEGIDPEDNLDHEFEDIVELSRGCKFSNCMHTNEIDCAVKRAISDGILLEERFHNYYREKNETEYLLKQKNKTKTIDYMKQRQLFKRS